MDEDALHELDAAIIGTRRFFAGPPDRVRDHRGRVYEGSTLLVVDALARHAEQPVAIGRLASLLDVTPSTVSRLVDRAEHAGAVRRSAARDDRRSTVVALTARGRRLAEDSLAARTAYLGELVDGWHRSDVRTLAGLLGDLGDRARSNHAARRREHQEGREDTA